MLPLVPFGCVGMSHFASTTPMYVSHPVGMMVVHPSEQSCGAVAVAASEEKPVEAAMGGSSERCVL